ncbi:MAG TPA: tetratricopeptide repeat protein [Candidatus Pullilachnospira intestinigallinarum]|nr:tetratricopeptide repeat protein [Candidatus Pullilachnospira intestinigallinarum]
MKKRWILLGCMLLLTVGGCGSSQADALYNSGIEALNEGDYEGAAETFDQLTRMGKRLPEAYRGEGIAWLRQEAYPEAIAAFSRSLNYMDFSNGEFERDVTCYLAAARLAYGETEKAIDLYSGLLKKKADPQYYYLRGKAYLIQGDLEKAQKDFERALKDSTDYNSYITVYQLYVDQGQGQQGQEWLEMALQLTPETGEDYYQQGRIFVLQEEYEEAADALVEAVNLEDTDAMLLLGSVYLNMGDSASARSMYQNYLTSGEYPGRGYNGLALCDIYEGSYDSALQNIQSGLDAGEDEEARRSLLYNEIVVYEHQEDFATAKSKMAEYLAEYPGDQDAVRENQFLSTR